MFVGSSLYDPVSGVVRESWNLNCKKEIAHILMAAEVKVFFFIHQHGWHIDLHCTELVISEQMLWFGSLFKKCPL